MAPNTQLRRSALALALLVETGALLSQSPVVSAAGPRAGAMSSRFPSAAAVTRPRLRPVRSVAEIAPTTETPSLAKRRKGRLNIRIDDEWYDLTNWRAAHPAGTHWIDAYNNSDATEVMYGFHSDEALGMFKRLPKSKDPPSLRPPTAATYAFRELRRKLVADGWYKPTVWGETKKLLPWAITTAAGVVLARQSGLGFFGKLAAITLLACGNSLSGWLAHDYVHGRNAWGTFMWRSASSSEG